MTPYNPEELPPRNSELYSLDIAALLDTSVEPLIQAAPKSEQPALSLDAAIGQQAALSHVIQRLSTQPDAIPLVHGLLDTLETGHTGDRS